MRSRVSGRSREDVQEKGSGHQYGRLRGHSTTYGCSVFMADHVTGMKAAAKKNRRAIVESTQDEHNTVALWILNSMNRILSKYSNSSAPAGGSGVYGVWGAAVYSEEHVYFS